jgi:hypothetical protein
LPHLIFSRVGFFKAPLTKLKLNDAELPIGELKTATSVDLSHKNLKPTDAIIIASLMSMVNAPLTNLDLRYNDLDAGAKELVRGAVKEGMKLEL